MTDRPVVLFYLSKACGHCDNFMKLLKTTNSDPSIIDMVAEIYPALRFLSVTSNDMSGVFDETVVPRGLLAYHAWFPMVLLIPGPTWQKAFNTDETPNHQVEIKTGVQIMNGKWKFNHSGIQVVEHIPYYNPNNKLDFVLWLKTVMNNYDFLAAQNLTNPLGKLVEYQPSPQATSSQNTISERSAKRNRDVVAVTSVSVET